MRILIATDGSEASKTVIETTCKIIAHPETTEVKIVSVVEPITPMGTEPFAVSAEYYAAMESAARGQAHGFVDEAENRLKETLASIIRISKDVLIGPCAPSIVEAANEWGADLIVVGSHGYGFWSRTFLGSVSNAIVHHASCSVLVVREKEEVGS